MSNLIDDIQVGLPAILGRFSVIPLLRSYDIAHDDYVGKLDARGDPAGRARACVLAWNLERAPNQVGAIYLHGYHEMGFDIYAMRKTHGEHYRDDFTIFAGQHIFENTPTPYLRSEAANPFCARGLRDYLPNDGRANPTDLRDALASYHSDVLSMAEGYWASVLELLRTPDSRARRDYLALYPYQVFGIGIDMRPLAALAPWPLRQAV